MKKTSEVKENMKVKINIQDKVCSEINKDIDRVLTEKKDSKLKIVSIS